MIPGLFVGRSGGNPSNATMTAAIDAAVTGLLDLKGSTDCSSNPNYPSASKGDYYVVSVAGRIGGGSGIVVAAGDVYFALADNAGGTQAGVGTSWDVIEGNAVAATTSVAGLTRYSTTAEAITGTDAASAATPAALFAAVSGYTTTATAAGTTTLTVSSNPQQFFTGSSAQNCDMPVASTLQLGQTWTIVNNSTGIVTVRSSGGNTIVSLPGGCQAVVTCILASGTTAASWNSGPVTGSGTYTPTLTAVANVAASQNYVCLWMRVGSVVTVSGRLDIDPTAAAPTATELGISLPIASNFAAIEDCGGVASARAVTDASGAITADATNDRARLEYLTSNLNNHAMVFTFTYRII